MHRGLYRKNDKWNGLSPKIKQNKKPKRKGDADMRTSGKAQQKPFGLRFRTQTGNKLKKEKPGGSLAYARPSGYDQMAQISLPDQTQLGH